MKQYLFQIDGLQIGVIESNEEEARKRISEIQNKIPDLLKSECQITEEPAAFVSFYQKPQRPVDA